MVSPAASAAVSLSSARGRSAIPSGGRRSASRGARNRAARSASAIPRATSSRAVSGRIRIAVASAVTFDSSIEGAAQAIPLTRSRYHRDLWITFFLEPFGLGALSEPFGLFVAARRPAGLTALLLAL